MKDNRNKEAGSIRMTLKELKEYVENMDENIILNIAFEKEEEDEYGRTNGA